MARMFLVKAGKHVKGDFGMTEPSEFIWFYEPTLKGLRGLMRCITPQGYRVPQPATLSKRINEWDGHLKQINPFFKTVMSEIIEVNIPINIEKVLDYENSFGFNHRVKMVNPHFAESIYQILTTKN